MFITQRDNRAEECSYSCFNKNTPKFRRLFTYRGLYARSLTIRKKCQAFSHLHENFHYPGEHRFVLSERMVILDKPLGITVAPDPVTGQIIVQDVKPGASAKASHLVQVGDVVKQCGAVFGDEMWQANDVRRLKWATANRADKIKLVLQRDTLGNPFPTNGGCDPSQSLVDPESTPGSPAAAGQGRTPIVPIKNAGGLTTWYHKGCSGSSDLDSFGFYHQTLPVSLDPPPPGAGEKSVSDGAVLPFSPPSSPPSSAEAGSSPEGWWARNDVCPGKSLVISFHRNERMVLQTHQQQVQRCADARRQKQQEQHQHQHQQVQTAAWQSTEVLTVFSETQCTLCGAFARCPGAYAFGPGAGDPFPAGCPGRLRLLMAKGGLGSSAAAGLYHPYPPHQHQQHQGSPAPPSPEGNVVVYGSSVPYSVNGIPGSIGERLGGRVWENGDPSVGPVIFSAGGGGVSPPFDAAALIGLSGVGSLVSSAARALRLVQTRGELQSVLKSPKQPVTLTDDHIHHGPHANGTPHLVDPTGGGLFGNLDPLLSQVARQANGQGGAPLLRQHYLFRDPKTPQHVSVIPKAPHVPTPATPTTTSPSARNGTVGAAVASSGGGVGNATASSSGRKEGVIVPGQQSPGGHGNSASASGNGIIHGVNRNGNGATGDTLCPHCAANGTVAQGLTNSPAAYSPGSSDTSQNNATVVTGTGTNGDDRNNRSGCSSSPLFACNIPAAALSSELPAGSGSAPDVSKNSLLTPEFSALLPTTTSATTTTAATTAAGMTTTATTLEVASSSASVSCVKVKADVIQLLSEAEPTAVSGPAGEASVVLSSTPTSISVASPRCLLSEVVARTDQLQAQNGRVLGEAASSTTTTMVASLVSTSSASASGGGHAFPQTVATATTSATETEVGTAPPGVSAASLSSSSAGSAPGRASSSASGEGKPSAGTSMDGGDGPSPSRSLALQRSSDASGSSDANVIIASCGVKVVSVLPWLLVSTGRVLSLRHLTQLASARNLRVILDLKLERLPQPQGGCRLATAATGSTNSASANRTQGSGSESKGVPGSTSADSAVGAVQKAPVSEPSIDPCTSTNAEGSAGPSGLSIHKGSKGSVGAASRQAADAAKSAADRLRRAKNIIQIAVAIQRLAMRRQHGRRSGVGSAPSYSTIGGVPIPPGGKRHPYHCPTPGDTEAAAAAAASWAGYTGDQRGADAARMYGMYASGSGSRSGPLPCVLGSPSSCVVLIRCEHDGGQEDLDEAGAAAAAAVQTRTGGAQAPTSPPVAGGAGSESGGEPAGCSSDSGSGSAAVDASCSLRTCPRYGKICSSGASAGTGEQVGPVSGDLPRTGGEGEMPQNPQAQTQAQTPDSKDSSDLPRTGSSLPQVTPANSNGQVAPSSSSSSSSVCCPDEGSGEASSVPESDSSGDYFSDFTGSETGAESRGKEPARAPTPFLDWFRKELDLESVVSTLLVPRWEEDVAASVAGWLHWFRFLPLQEAILFAETAFGTIIDYRLLEAAGQELLRNATTRRSARSVLTWRYGGFSAFVAGDVVGSWSHRVPLARCDKSRGCRDGSMHGHFHLVIQGLKPGTYYYKFVVDGIWTVDPTNPKVLDSAGNWNNVLVVAEPPAVTSSKDALQLMRWQAMMLAFENKMGLGGSGPAAPGCGGSGQSGPCGAADHWTSSSEDATHGSGVYTVSQA